MFDTIQLTNTLKDAFFNEVKNILTASSDQKTILELIDTATMKIKIGTVYANELVPNRLLNLLDTTTDTSLIKYKALLLKLENVLLAKTVEMLCFNAEFLLKLKPSATQEKELTKQVFFNINNSPYNGSIKLLPNNNLRIQINKRYTVLGSFVQLTAE